MTVWQALLLGAVQGLTEFLPVSSTAHLRLVPALLGWEGDPAGAAFTAVVQLGTLAAVFWYFRRDVARLAGGFLRGLRSGRPLADPDGFQAWLIVAGTVPIVALGLAFKDDIETTFRSLYVIAGALIGLALLLMVAELAAARAARRRGLGDLGWLDAAVIGLFQAAALVPGASRSGVTITGGLFRGLGREAAARFSFLLSLPSILGAGLFQLVGAREELFASGADALNLLVATVTAGAFGYASIAFLLGYLRRRSTALFIVYRIILGVLILALLSAGLVEP